MLRSPQLWLTDASGHAERFRAQREKGDEVMRKLTVAVAALGMLVAGCGSDHQSSPASSTSTTSSRPPVAQAALANLTVTPAEIDSTMGLTGTTSKHKIDKLPDDSNKAWPQGW